MDAKHGSGENKYVCEECNTEYDSECTTVTQTETSQQCTTVQDVKYETQYESQCSTTTPYSSKRLTNHNLQSRPTIKSAPSIHIIIYLLANFNGTNSDFSCQ